MGGVKPILQSAKRSCLCINLNLSHMTAENNHRVASDLLTEDE